MPLYFATRYTYMIHSKEELIAKVEAFLKHWHELNGEE